MNAYLNDMISSLQWLIRIDSVEDVALPNKPFGEGCHKALQYTLSLCKSLGLETKNVDGYAGHAEIGEGELFGILGHLDTVPYSNDWSYPPTGGVIDNNRLYGRGALDNKGPMIACLYAVKALLDEGLKPKKRIRLIFGLDEESGWKCMEHYFKNEEMPAMGFSPDADFPVINCEKGMSYFHIKCSLPDNILTIKGGVRPNMVPDYAIAEVLSPPTICSNAKVSKKANSYIIETFGKASHASHANEGVNALWDLFDILSVNYGGIFTTIAKKLTTTDGSKCSLQLKDMKSGSLTMNLGTAEIKNNELLIVIDVRHPISIAKEEILNILQSEMQGFTVIQGGFHKPLYVEPDHPLVNTLLSAYNDVTKENQKPITIGGGTYARALPLGVAFGPIFPGQESTIHKKDEFIDLDDLLKMSKIYYEAIKRLCF